MLDSDPEQSQEMKGTSGRRMHVGFSSRVFA
jgi:hypothetical protein